MQSTFRDRARDGKQQQLVDEFGEACPSQARELSTLVCVHIIYKFK